MIQVIEHIRELDPMNRNLRENGRTIGFVPTMGALHEGHLSLIKNSIENNDATVVSIFVNPTQFNDQNDLLNYPRTLDDDLKLLNTLKCDIVFVPSVKEMYPEKDTRVFNFGTLDKIMEGKHRPGHFIGVAQIVSKFFNIIQPDKAYFGQKDFQQLAIIKKLVTDYNYPVEIIPCPIIRENDGLAMSSRNRLLSSEQRKHATLISQALFNAQKMAGINSVQNVIDYVVSTINNDPLLETEYFEIVDSNQLLPVKSWDEPSFKVGCVAVKIGEIRLIDNINFIL
ncbi:MAG: pantoate--beta-alanine ligase [Bacteroidales bacterium]|nr:pantoate--beta-alanine ligase [Bacteroidales bacterium]